MATEEIQENGKVAYGQLSYKGGRRDPPRGLDVELLKEKLSDSIAAEFASTYYYYTILRMYLAGHEDYKEICEDARLQDRAHYELMTRASTN